MTNATEKQIKLTKTQLETLRWVDGYERYSPLKTAWRLADDAGISYSAARSRLLKLDSLGLTESGLVSECEDGSGRDVRQWDTTSAGDDLLEAIAEEEEAKAERAAAAIEKQEAERAATLERIKVYDVTPEVEAALDADLAENFTNIGPCGHSLDADGFCPECKRQEIVAAPAEVEAPVVVKRTRIIGTAQVVYSAWTPTTSDASGY